MTASRSKSALSASLYVPSSSLLQIVLPSAPLEGDGLAALGSCAYVMAPEGREAEVARVLRTVRGVYQVLHGPRLAEWLSLPDDRIGNLVVFAPRSGALGRRPGLHDTASLAGPLWGCGSLEETSVPLLLNRPLRDGFQVQLDRGHARNFHLFDFLVNGTDAERRGVVARARALGGFRDKAPGGGSTVEDASPLPPPWVDPGAWDHTNPK